MLDDRKKRVLKAIIEEYIDTAEPVSSASIVKNHNLDFSSATIRNDMSELEQLELLEKPHTSAGRVPSNKGYRYYVDKLLKNNNISLNEIEFLKSKLIDKVNEIEDLTKITTHTLSEMTHYTALSIEPDINTEIISDIKFVLLGSRVLLAVILTDSGLIKETIIKFEQDITGSQVESLNFLFNNTLKGQPLKSIDKPIKEYIFSEMSNQINILQPIIKQIDKLEQKNNIYLEGTNKVFDLPEFKKTDLAKNFMDLINEKDLVKNLLNENSTQMLNIYIGNENINDKLKDFSIITFKNVINGKNLGTIGIIGPTRMDYSKVISIIKYINNKFNKLE